MVNSPPTIPSGHTTNSHASRSLFSRCISRFLHALCLLLLVGGGTGRVGADQVADGDARLEPTAVHAVDQPGSSKSEHAMAPELEAAYTQLRGLAIEGDQAGALHGLLELLTDELPATLRIRVYATAISLASNLEDWPHAFTLLNEAMELLPPQADDRAWLLGIASLLYVRVGEIERAIDLGHQALEAAEASSDPRQICRSTAALAAAHEEHHEFALALSMRQRQIESCSRSNEPLFTATGKYGLGKALAEQGAYVQALQWGEEALSDYLAIPFKGGVSDAQMLIARSLIALHREPTRADAILDSLETHYAADKAIASLAETMQLRADLAESQGDVANSLSHLKRAMELSREADRRARARHLAYLQMQFDTRVKAQQITLLETQKALAEANATAAQQRQQLLVIGLLALLTIAALLALLLRRTLLDRRRYRWRSEHDGLTRLANQQHLYRAGSRAFEAARARASPFCAIALDIDLFKQINDRHGHAAGDEALRKLGCWIREVLAGEGIAARRGGDEFMILLDADVARAGTLLQHLRERIAPVTAHGRTFRFTISAGICSINERTTTLAQLLHETDKMLYRAKQLGRARVVCCHDAPQTTTLSHGSLVIVGSGIQFGRHASERTLSEIQQAQVVFCLVDPFALAMITRLRPDAINLGVHYAPNKDRRETYREIGAVIMREVRAGKAVCAVFYGHPGVFADVPHQVIRTLRAEGLVTRMEAGISAEACLYADLGIDPGRRGVQSLEATHFLYHDRQIDPQGLVLLWQVTLAGDTSCRRLHAEREGLQALVTKLLRWYPPDHEVILYEAAQLPVENFRADTLRLDALPDAHYKEFTMLVIPALSDELAHDPEFTPLPT